MSKYYIGKTFTAKPANKTATPKSTTSYQWLSESLPLSGETGTTYVTSSVDVGNQLQVRQMETNRYGAASATSSNVEVFTSNYGITDTEPYLMADFLGGYYRSDYRDSTFGDTFEYSTTGLSTMIDSDGILKWAPHNRLAYNEDFFQAAWLKTNMIVSSDNLAAFGGFADKLIGDTGTAYASMRIRPIASSANPVTTRVVAKAAEWGFMRLFHDGPNTAQWFDLNTGALSAIQGNASLFTSAITSLGDGWYQCDFTTNIWTAGRDLFIHLADDSTATPVCDGVSGLHIRSITQFDASLPMADNPDAADPALVSHVVTGATGIYLPRRNAYYYDTITSSWKNGGLLLESEARTNLDPNSDNLSAWTTTNITVAKDQTGAGGNANEAHSITATSDAGTVLEQITASSNSYVWSCLMKRITGTGTVEVTVDGGSTWVDVTNSINSSHFIQVGTGSGIVVTDPEFGIRLGTSGDAVAVQNSQLEQTNAHFSSSIPTTGSTITRPAQDLNVYYNKILGIGGVAMQGSITFTDEDVALQQTFWRRYKDADEYIIAYMDTDSSTNLELNVEQSNVGSVGSVTLSTEYAPSLRTFYNFASSHGTNTINLNDGADTGTANTTSGTLPSFTTQDLDLGYDYMGMISAVTIYENTLSDALLAESSVDFQFWLRGDSINTDGIWVDSVGWE